ncbi:MAG TPA: extracellular solute-binding protein [Thermoanaerobaculia bacterium]|nr:extracellular solute-binding protein [Thermoanaerobaculia bacterium]
MIKRYALHLAALVLAVVLAVAASACGGGDGGGSEEGTGTVSVLSLWGGSEQEAFQKVLAQFTKDTGIKTKYETARDFLPVIRSRLAAGNPPMVAIIPRPGIVQDLANEGSLISLDDLGVDADAVNQNYGEAWTNLTTVDGTTYGVVAKANSKSVVWYRPDDDKVKPVETWDELVQLTDQLKTDAVKPWALGAKDSWTLTDWFENIYARTAGPEKYNQLFSGELDFTDASVKEALRMMTEVLNDETVVGGIDGALGTGFVDGIGQVFSASPKAHLYMEGGFVGGIALADVNPNLKPGQTIDFFPFPTIDEAQGDPLVGGGDITAAFVNNEDVKQLIEYLASKEAGEIWVSTGAIVSPNQAVEASAYPNELVRKEAEQVKNAETFVFDGSDLLPGALGEDWGTLLQTVVKNPNQIDSQLQEFQQNAQDAFAG